MNKRIFTIVIAIAALVAGGLLGMEISTSRQAPSQELALGEMNRFTSGVTNTKVSCGTTSTLALATSSSRMYVALVNDSASTVYLGLGAAAVGSNGIRLNSSGGAYEINLDNLYTGPIYCIASSTAIMTVLYK